MRLLLDYRRNAAECRKIAQLISLRDERERLLRMAKEWEHLAEEREARLGLQRGTQADGPDHSAAWGLTRPA